MMKSLRYDIEIEEIKPQAKLLDKNLSNIVNMGAAAKLTHETNDLEDIMVQGIGDDNEMQRMTRKMVELGHESTLEHSYFFLDVICSRVCSHQLVRQRVGTSYSQRSERYTGFEDGVKVIVPPTIRQDSVRYTTFTKDIKSSVDTYFDLIEQGVPKEDARFVLPRVATELAFSLNGRSLRHFLKLRYSPHAQWEIRRIATQIKQQVEEEFGDCLTFDIEYD